MKSTYATLVRNAGKAAVTHIGLVNGSGVELSGGSYARIAEAWADDNVTPNNGRIRLAADRVFQVPAGSTVAGWRGYTALTLGTEHGGAALPSEAFTNAGEYRLLAASTYIDHAVDGV